MLDKTDATKLVTRIRRQWFAKRKSVGAILKEVMTNEASALLDTDAHNKAIDADAALQELGTDQIGQAFVTATSPSGTAIPVQPMKSSALVEKVIQGRDFTCMIRDRECGRGLARQPAGPCLCQRPAAAGLDPQSRPYGSRCRPCGRAR